MNKELHAPLLTILIVNYNSADFINSSIKILELLTKNPYCVYIMDNGSKVKDYEKLIKHCGRYENVTILKNETSLVGSLAHGTALNKLINYVNTPLFSILDADATWLKKDWDKILIAKLSEKVKVIGTQAPPPKHQDFPLMFAILFETETFKKLNIDFRPSDPSQRQDTGWEMREKYLAAGYHAINLEFKNTRTYKDGPFRGMTAIGEFYLENDYSNIFASHFGRGSNPFAKQRWQSNNLIIVKFLAFLNYLSWKKDKAHWIERCLKIASEQHIISS